MNVSINNSNITPLQVSRRRAINDILTVYNSDRFTNVKNNTLRTIDLLYKLGYYQDSESLFQER